MMPTDVSLRASSSTFCFASSSVRSATRSSSPSSVSRSLPVIVLKATASAPTSSFVVTGASRSRSPAATAWAVSVIARIGRAIRRMRDTCRSRAGRRRAGRRRRWYGERAGGREGGMLVLLGDQACADLVEPAVRPDHGDARVVAVEASAGFACDCAVDPGRGDAGGERAGVHCLVDEVPVLADEVGGAGLAEPCRGQHDPVEALEVEVGGDDADALAAAVEQRRGDRDRRFACQ